MMNPKNTGSMDKSVKDKESNKNGTPKNVDKNGTKSKIRKAYLRDKKAPKPPLSGYIRFLNDRRQQFCSQNSNLPFSEITKILATEWNQMPKDKKQPYLLAAEQERIKYVEEFEAYKKTDAYRNFMELKSNRAKYHIPTKKDRESQKKTPSNDTKFKKDQEFKKEKPSTSSSGDREYKKEKPSTSSSGDREYKKEKPSTSSSGDQEFKKGNLSISSNNNTVHDITIFTEEFLNFNKARDIELRNFRKKVTDQKQEVCVLDKHIENMQNFSTKLVAHNEQLNAECSKYEQYLIKLRSKLLDAFANVAFPDNTAPPTHENIDEYIINYSRHQTTGTETDPSWIKYFKKGLSNLDPSQC